MFSLGMYGYKELNLNYNETKIGGGIDLLNLYGIDVSIKAVGIEVTFSFYDALDSNKSEFISIGVDLFGDTSISIGSTFPGENGAEISDQYSFEVNTTDLINFAFFVYTYQSIEQTIQTKTAQTPGYQPVPTQNPARVPGQ